MNGRKAEENGDAHHAPERQGFHGAQNEITATGSGGEMRGGGGGGNVIEMRTTHM